MKLVIEIPEDIYEQTINGTEFDTLSLGIKLKQSVQKGIVIPKGHGRIIDESQITGTFTWDNGFIECFAPTIIEADRGESEDME